MRRVGAAAALVLVAPAVALAQPQLPPAIPPPAPGAVSAMTALPCTAGSAAQTDWAALCHYRDANRAIDPGIRAVLTGDSITEFWLPTAPALFAGGVVDRGVSGQTCTQIAARFYQDVVRLRPRVVQIMCGTNDIAGNTGPMRLEDIEANYASMAEIAGANNVRVVLSSVLPVNN